MSTFLTIVELSHYLHIKRSTLYAWVERGFVPHYKVNRLIRFNKDEIDAWLEDFRKKEPQAQKITFNDKECDIDSLIARAKREVYNGKRGETRPESSPEKEKNNGAV